MATYNRYKEFKRQNASREPVSSTVLSSARDRAENQTITNVTNEKDGFALDISPSSEMTAGASQPMSATSPVQLSSASPFVFNKSTPSISSSFFAGFGRSNKVNETTNEIYSLKSSTPINTLSSKRSHEDRCSTSREQQTDFIFSNPIVLKVPKDSPVIPSDTQFTFSRPKSYFKTAVPVENSSFLPTLMSQRQPSLVEKSCPPKKGIEFQILT